MQRLIDGGHAYAAGGDVYFDVTLLPGLRRAVRAAPRPHAARRGHRDRRRQTRPAGLRPVEGRQARRALLGDPVGAGPARLAPRMLGDVDQVPRPDVRHPRRRPRPGVPAPRERAGPVARGRRRVRAVLDAQRPRRGRRGEDEQVARQLAARRRDGDPGPPGRAALLPRPGPLPVQHRVLPGGPGRGGDGLPADRGLRGAGRRADRRHPGPGRGGTGCDPPGLRRRARRRPRRSAGARGRARDRPRRQQRAGRRGRRWHWPRR